MLVFCHIEKFTNFMVIDRSPDSDRMYPGWILEGVKKKNSSPKISQTSLSYVVRTACQGGVRMDGRDLSPANLGKEVTSLANFCACRRFNPSKF